MNHCKDPQKHPQVADCRSDYFLICSGQKVKISSKNKFSTIVESINIMKNIMKFLTNIFFTVKYIFNMR